MASKETKRMKQVRTLVEPEALYDLDKAMTVLGEYKESCKAKFDETVEVVFVLGVDPKHADQMVRGMVAMPKGLGKEVKVAVFCNPNSAQEAKDAGADFYDSDQLVADLEKGKIAFDVCVATPDMMVTVGKLGKILGPKGLMPNPKLGTVGTDIAAMVQSAKAGQVEYRTDKCGIVNVGVGKLSFSSSDLLENIRSLVSAIVAAKPSAAKGKYLKKAYLSTSMGGSIPLDLGAAMK